MKFEELAVSFKFKFCRAEKFLNALVFLIILSKKKPSTIDHNH